MRILLVSPGFPPDRIGGIENYVNLVYKNLKKRGHDARILTQFHHDELCDPGIVQVQVSGGEARQYAQWIAKAWFRLLSTNPDVVHFNGFQGQLLSLAPLPRLPKIVHAHNSITRESSWWGRQKTRHLFGHLLVERAFRRADVIISPTNAVKGDILRNIEGLDSRKVEVIPNCVDTKYFSPGMVRSEIRDELSLGGKFVFLYFGRIKATKGIEDICKAFMIVRRSIDAALIVAGGQQSGEGHLVRYLRETYKGVTFTGFVDDPRKYYAAADAFCINTPGFHGGETFAIALAEAMSMGLPTVCSDNPIFREVTRENALFARAQNPDLFAESMLQMAGNPSEGERMGAIGRGIAEKLYDVVPVTSRLERVYEEAVQAE